LRECGVLDFEPAALQAVIDAAGGCGGIGRGTREGWEVRPEAGRDFEPAVRAWLAAHGFTRRRDRRGPCYLRPWPMAGG